MFGAANYLFEHFTHLRAVVSGAAAPEPPLPAALGLLRRACCHEQGLFFFFLLSPKCGSGSQPKLLVLPILKLKTQ